MSWWSNKKEEPSSASSSSYDTFDSQSSFSNQEFAAPSSPTSYGGGSSGSFEQEVMQLQQTTMVQAVMLKLTETSFERCISKPSNSLSSSERSCIAAVVGKYLESSEFVVQKFSGGSE